MFIQTIDYILHIRNKNVNLLTSVLFVISVSIVLSLISKFVEINSPFHKKYCDKENTVLCPTFPILFVRFLHYTTSIFFSLYYFIFNSTYDIYYLILYVILIYHWLFANDCILSNWELAFYNEGKGNLGETGLLHPHLRVFLGEWTDYLIFFQLLLMTSSFLLVINRLKSKYYPILFAIMVLILQSYLVLKDRVGFLFE